jgi:hypothetical protein
MNEIFNNVKAALNSSSVSKGYVVAKTQAQLEKTDEFTCATKPHVALIGDISTKNDDYGIIIDRDRTILTVINHRGEAETETRIDNDKFYLGNKAMKLVPALDDSKVFFKLEIDTEAKSAPAMTADLVAKYANR